MPCLTPQGAHSEQLHLIVGLLNTQGNLQVSIVLPMGYIGATWKWDRHFNSLSSI